MIVKQGVGVTEMHPATRYALDVVDEEWRRVTGQQPTLTSLQEGRHSERSYHYGVEGDIRCRAWDIRTRGVPEAKVSEAVGRIRHRLGPDFDVIIESDHVHGEYDPE